MRQDDRLVYRVIEPCEIDPTARVEYGAIIGQQYRQLIGHVSAGDPGPPDATVLGERSYVGPYAIIGSGSRVGRGAVIDGRVTLEECVAVGEGSLVTYAAIVCSEVVIGAGCVVGGFIGERTQIGDRARVFGSIVHSQWNPSLEWDAPDSEEASAHIGAAAFVAFGAIVVGGIRIGEGAYVAAGAIVTRDVPPRHIVHGKNRISSPAEWKGRLGDADFFLGGEARGS